jgi:hypothetical protein
MAELTMPDLAAAMRAAVRGLVDRLDPEQHRRVSSPFDATCTSGGPTSPVSDPASDSAT